MKRNITLIIVLTIISIQVVSAGGVGITPAHYKEFFEPNLEKTFKFYSFNTDPNEGIEIYIEGDLAEYVELSDEFFVGGGGFTVTVKLPNKIDKPGVHEIYVGAIEAREIGSETIGGIVAIRGRIDILVPYPGEYAESTFTISNINEGEEANYEIEVQNLGTKSLNVKPSIEIYKINTTEKLLTLNLPDKIINPKEILNSVGTLNTKELPPGEYQAIAIIDWGKIDTMTKIFRVGEFLIEILDYDYQFEQNRINQFNIEIQNKWNTKIDQVFATVSITDQGNFITNFKTVSANTNPWETKNLTAYFDTTGLETKRYTANIVLSYGDTTTGKLVAIYINKSPRDKYIKYATIATIIALIIIATFIYLILKIKRLSKRNGKKK
ncbi:MAG: hypothetical protein KJ592_02230 [Nanoarchaeota archaeon]|nr:hypothetical protein [Nanoarchaeota archaeon]